MATTTNYLIKFISACIICILLYVTISIINNSSNKRIRNTNNMLDTISVDHSNAEEGVNNSDIIITSSIDGMLFRPGSKIDMTLDIASAPGTIISPGEVRIFSPSLPQKDLRYSIEDGSNDQISYVKTKTGYALKIPNVYHTEYDGKNFLPLGSHSIRASIYFPKLKRIVHAKPITIKVDQILN